MMKYTGVTDGDLYHGHMRFDVNISLSADRTQLGTRSEVKNLNSFRNVEAVVNYEIKRQAELLKKGEKVVQDTRGWDEAKQKTFAQRTKEEAEDYRYMPEPDIPPIELSDEWVASLRKKMPKTPAEIRTHLAQVDLGSKVIEDILDRPSVNTPVLDVLAKAGPQDAKRTAFWLIAAEPADDSGDMHPNVDSDRLISLSKMVDEGQLSSTAAKRVFDEILSSADTPEQIAARLNLLQVSDTAQLEKIVSEVIEDNAQVAEDIRGGQEKAIGFLVGQVMAKTKGQANPQVAQDLIRKQLSL
jgi:aspartyl-tRNA(Asn)/glutamyl-tRNA(Gln) amidotransferase subunit B